MNWDALYIAMGIALVINITLLTVIGTPGEHEGNDAFLELQKMNADEEQWRKRNGIEPVIL